MSVAVADMDQPARERVGIVDLGSNSIRLVVYDRLARTAQPLFNERIICGIGRDVATTGMLAPDGVELALRNLTRFAALARAMHVHELEILATAATRDAADGPLFLDQVAQLFGMPVRQLDGGAEARLAALGVVSGIPDADGISGDLGGGSLELAALDGGEIGDIVTLPLGPLRLLAEFGPQRAELQARIDATLAELPWLASHGGRNFYAVGGAWRTLASVHMDQVDYPLHIIHSYRVTGREAADLCKVISRLSPATLARMRGVSSKRAPYLPVAALVMRRLLKILRPNWLEFSAYGIREGNLFERLDPVERSVDPLLAACADIATRESRFGNRGDLLFDWVSPLFAETADAVSTRLCRAACLLADIGWQVHPSYRAEQIYLRILRLPITGVDHVGWAKIAMAVFVRYGGLVSDDKLGLVGTLLGEEDVLWARRVGTALRLAETLAAGMPEILAGSRLRIADKELRLELDASTEIFVGDVVAGRFEALATLLDLKPIVAAR
jgi:exopolyphosphatase/guanosine-5'-triphosphate,3'-diphosphate pyrophosphatase